MADIYGSHFEYAGISSRQYGLIIANVQTERYTNIAGSIEGISVFNKKSKKRYLIGDDYDSFPLTYEVDIVTDDDRGIEFNARREIEKWLFNKHEYKKLYLDAADDTAFETVEIIDGVQKRLYLNCRFVNPERLEYNGGIIGYRVTIEADSGMWWQDAVTKTFTISSQAQQQSEVIFTTDSETDLYPGDVDWSVYDVKQAIDNGNTVYIIVRGITLVLTSSGEYEEEGYTFFYYEFSGVDENMCLITCELGTVDEAILIRNHGYTQQNIAIDPRWLITVDVDTDIDEYTYPKVTIQMGSSGGNVAIANVSDVSSRATVFTGLPPLSTVIIKSDLNYIGGQYYEKFTSRNFPRLLDGENNIAVLGDVASISFEFSNRRAL